MPIIVAGVENQPPVFGRNWLYNLKLDWKVLKVTDLCKKYEDVFKEGLGTIKGYEGRIYLKENSQPKFHKARPVPFALKPIADKELDRLEKAGVIRKVDRSDWASPMLL